MKEGTNLLRLIEFSIGNMKFCFAFFLISLSINFSLFSQENIVEGNIIIQFNSTLNERIFLEQIDFLDVNNIKLKKAKTISSNLNIDLYSFDENSINRDSLLKLIKNNRNVKIAQFNHVFKSRETIPNDTLFPSQWSMNNIGQGGGKVDADIDAIEAWDISTGGVTADGDTIVVAIIDGGFSLTHPDLDYWKNYKEIPNNVIDDDNNGYIDDFDGWNASNENDNWTPESHGTHVAGIVGARGNNNFGVAGVNLNVKILPISYGNGTNFESDVIASYNYARDLRLRYNTTNGLEGAFIVCTNSSFGINFGKPEDYPLWCEMYNALGQVGILSAGATANSNFNIDATGDIPTACTSDWLITVTNTTFLDLKNTNCGYGTTTIDLGAPGTNVLSTYFSNGIDNYSNLTGTSMATPHVAGAIALMYSIKCDKFIKDYKSKPDSLALYVKNQILQNVDSLQSLSNGKTVSGGRLNLFNSLKTIENYCNTPIIADSIPVVDIKFNIFPNPFQDNITISGLNSLDFTIKIVDCLGKIILNKSIIKNKENLILPLNKLESGLYFVNIETDTIKFEKRIIKL